MINVQKIWLTHEPWVRSFVFSMVKNQNVTDDIVQDVFETVITKQHQLKDSAKVKSWIGTIARNTTYDHLRKNARFLPQDPSGMKELRFSEELGSNSESDHSIKCFKAFIDQLPSKYKEVIIVVELKGRSQKWFAQQKGISYSGAKSRLQRARKKLKELLLSCCDFETDVYGNVLDRKPKHGECLVACSA